MTARESEKEEEAQLHGARVTTRTGDDGYTGLLGPERVPKYSDRIEAVGTLDEATSALGLARSLCRDDRIAGLILELQQGLYKLMAELATPASQLDKVPFRTAAEDVERLDGISGALKAEVEIGKEFIVPGATRCGAALDLARTIVRRAERLTARLVHQGEVPNTLVLSWLNRLSDTIFILARCEERDVGSQRSQMGREH
jgi:cob(I)alamin adenosyltransferase